MIRKPFDHEFTVSEAGAMPSEVSRAFYGYLATHGGRKIRLRLSRPQRTTQANNYLWGVVYPAIQRGLAEAGTAASAADIHKHFKAEYLPPRVFEVFGITHVEPPSSAKLDKEEFYDFVEAIRTDESVLALGVEIPDPDPSYRSYTLHDLD